MANPEKKGSLNLILVPDIWSGLQQLVAFARSYAIACLVRKSGKLFVGGKKEVTPEAIIELQNFEIVHLIIDGRHTKSKLSNPERLYFTDRIRESNAWLN